MSSIEFSEKEIVEFKKMVGLNVKRLREEANFSQMDLYEAIGHKSNSIVSQGELAKKNFNMEQLYKISKVLDCEMSEFFVSIESSSK